MNIRLTTGLFAAVLLASSPTLAHAEGQSFSDVPPGHPVYDAVEYLKSQGVISGYDDGTFKAERPVNRAEAAKIIVAPLVDQGKVDASKTSVYDDIAADAWFAPYVEIARKDLGIVDGPPKTTAFYGERPVIKVEFLKMLLLANKIDPGSYGEINLALSEDVTNPNEWYYPYKRYAITASIVMVDPNTGRLDPAKQLTRGDVALYLYRLMMYQQGRRTQALLSEAESEILVILNALEENNLAQAQFASARSLLAARGAHASQPDVPIVKGALKISEGFRALVRAYEAGVAQDFEQVVALCGDAWNLAAQANEITGDLTLVSEQVQKIAGSMADSAREIMASVQ